MMHRSHFGFLVLAAMLLHGAVPARASDWPTLHRDPARSGFTPDQVTAPIQLDWIAEFPGESLVDRLEVIVAEGKVYAGTLSGNLYALDRHTGRILWKHAGGAPVLHSPTVVGRTVYYATAGAQGALFALDTATGHQRWKVATPGGFAASPLVMDGLVYLGARNGCFYGIETGSGRVRFRFWTEGPIRSTAAAANGRVFFASDSMIVHALEAGTGRLLWKSAPVPGWSFRDCIPMVVGHRLIVRSGPAGQAAQRGAQDRDAGDSRPGTLLTHFVLDAVTGVQSVGQNRHEEATGTPAGSSARDSHFVPYGGTPPALTRDGRPIVLCADDLGRTGRASAATLSIGFLDPVRGSVEPVRLTESTPPRPGTGARAASTPAVSVGGNILYLSQHNVLTGMDLTTGSRFSIYGDSETRDAVRQSSPQESHLPGPAGGACSISDDQLFGISAGRIIAIRGNGSPRRPDALRIGRIENAGDRLSTNDARGRNQQAGKGPAGSAAGDEAAARLLFSPSRVRGIRGWRATSLKQALQEQVQALREGWPWAPHYVPVGAGGRDFLFAHPADSVTALAVAYPHLSGSTADWARAQAQVLLPRCLEDRDFSPNAGRRREFYAVPAAELTGSARVSPPLIARVYAVWLYGDRTGDWHSVETTYPRCLEVLRACLEEPPAMEDAAASSSANRVLMGLVAAARLASRFGDPGTQRSAEEQAIRLFGQVVSDYRRRGAEASQVLATPARGEDPLHVSAPFLFSPQDERPAPFMDLSPELGRALRAAVPDGVDALARAVRLLMPAYHLAGEETLLLGGRRGLELPDAAHAIFQAHAWLWVDSADALADQVDPARCRGDLFNIEELVTALEAFGTREWEGNGPPAPRSIAATTAPVDRGDANSPLPVSPINPAPGTAPAGDGIGSEPLPDPSGPPGERNPWRYIVIHHSASPSGNAAAFDRLHRSKGWDCVAYHFVITNGRGGPDGGLETGLRWEQQKHGAHAGGLSRGASSDLRNDYNEFGIGICLVGNFQNAPPTQAQLRTLASLVKRLQGEFGIPADRVFGHRHVRDTACPGGRFPWGQLYALMGLPTPGHLHRLAAAPTSDHCIWCQRREAMIASSSSTPPRGMPMSPASSMLPIPMMAPPAKR